MNLGVAIAGEVYATLFVDRAYPDGIQRATGCRRLLMQISAFLVLSVRQNDAAAHRCGHVRCGTAPGMRRCEALS
jgi:hypothetical protein